MGFRRLAWLLGGTALASGEGRWEKLNLPEKVFAYDSMQAFGNTSTAIASRMASDGQGRVFLSNRTREDSSNYSLLISEDRGASWRRITHPEKDSFQGLGHPQPVSVGADGLLLWGRLRFSRDFGNTWTVLEDPGSFVRPSAVHAGKRFWIAGRNWSNDLIDVSMDSGKTWNSSGRLNWYYGFRQFLEVDSVIFAAGRTLRQYGPSPPWEMGNTSPLYLSYFRLSLSRGPEPTVWVLGLGLTTPVRHYLLPFRGQVARDTIPLEIPFDLATAWLAAEDGAFWLGSWGKGVFRSHDQGKSWTPVNLGLGGLRVETLMQAPTGEIYMIAEGGLYRFQPKGVRIHRRQQQVPSQSAAPLLPSGRFPLRLFPDPISGRYYLPDGRRPPL